MAAPAGPSSPGAAAATAAKHGAPMPTAMTPSAAVLLLFNRDTQNDRGRARIGLALGAEAPGDLVVVLRAHNGPIALVVLACAASPRHASAAIVVRDDVIAPVRRIAAGADPRDRRHFGPRRTRIGASAITCAKRAVDRAIAPIIALYRIPRILRIAGALGRGLSGIGISGTMVTFRRARHRQQRQRGRTGKEGTEHAKDATARGTTRKPAHHFFRQVTKLSHSYSPEDARLGS